MNELILEVKEIIRSQKHLIERNKKYHEYPFMNDYATVVGESIEKIVASH